ncbi:NADPH:quinone reductase-like Zn-dependent oxidoreductase [Mycolicibacterium sp. BK556]|uniref:zinc-binding dehydrogenase n=1 Tax=unclassified Mycolicibacterium TaxID=2636767 RepID=UPI0016223229|nr:MULTISPECIES: zinc-binding dehydrogenase [unclassified Mycolicibacterium]MBB3606000.1 NADPH:quinone reductase-like Zn-dependent oxidoreductase [Mycolicibacterium sp. BK556]MBB3632577.1 NADPH:quinone reductase-like Zn-dependent oxidoreductase [Mycolicibacterium sp. BK607]
MHAVVIREFGEPEVLRPDRFPDPPATAGWVTVELRAAALNWHDVLVRQGRYRSPLPHVIGADGAGIRRDTGEPVVIVPSLRWGARDEAPGPDWTILGDHIPGTYAELVSVPADCLAPKPDGYSWHQAAALPLVGLTTYRALFSRGRLRPGETMLVVGAGGGIATMSVQLASGIGASIVVTSSSPGKITRAVTEGATAGVLHTDSDWPDQARALTPSAIGFDLVLDPVGRWPESIRALRPGGRLVVLGSNASDQAAMDVRGFYFGQYDLLGTTMGNTRDFAGLLRLLSEHRIPPPVIDRVFALDCAAQAHEHIETSTGFGKTVLEHV